MINKSIKYSKLILLFSLSSINIHASDLNTIADDLKSCKNYNSNNTEQNGVIEWINGVDSVDNCDKKTIDFLSSDLTLSTIDSNLATLGYHYRYCKGITILKTTTVTRKTKLINMQRLLPTCNSNKKETVDVISELDRTKQLYADETTRLNSLNKELNKLNQLISDARKNTNQDDLLLESLLEKKKVLKEIDEIKIVKSQIEEKFK